MTFSEADELINDIAEGLREFDNTDVDVVVCPPFPYLELIGDAAEDVEFFVGAQNVSKFDNGAYTGEVSAAMVKSTGCKYVILGHSERREYYGENSEILNRKMALAFENGLKPIYCVGEKLEEREAERHFEVVEAQIKEVLFNLNEEQMRNTVVAYEPVWAIGTGKTATSAQAQEIHAFIRKTLAEKFGELAQEITILYGGSCKPSNAPELFAQEDIDGGLIGGAALKAEDFIGIAKSY